MSFKYNNTCPIIDHAIEGFKENLRDKLDSIIDDLVPLLDGTDKKDELINKYTESIYSENEGYFENTRQSNVDMRSEAESQMEIVENELKESIDIISDLNDKISEYKSRITQLEEGISKQKKINREIKLLF